jgi:hypothetical protein
MLTRDEMTLLRDAYELRTWESDTPLHFGVIDDLLPQADRAVEAGVLERFWCRECSDHHYRISDLGIEAMEWLVGDVAGRN